ncbi:MAG: SagB/ThcOx family dehydrogenase [Bacillota bacterium]
MKIKVVLTAILIFTVSMQVQSQETIKLIDAQKNSGKPLMEALSLRQSSRNFINKPLTDQQLSNLLWAAFGINRPESGKRTAPSARNWQEIDIYLTTANGVYLYNAKDHSLIKISSEDIRAMAGKQDFVKDAAVNLIYVADYSKTGDSSQEDKLLYSGADTGFIAENVYLYCASEGLGAVVRGMVDRDILSKKLNLKEQQKIMLSQSVGYTK